MPSLEELRRDIDATDDEIVRLLMKRAELVLGVKAAKEKDNLDVYSSTRERQILDRVSKLAAQGNFPQGPLERIFSNIISASRSLIGELNVSFLGPENSVSKEAAVRQFGETIRLLPEKSLEDVIGRVLRGDAQYAVLPLRTQAGAVIPETYEGIMRSKLVMIAEIEANERFAVLGTKGPQSTGKDKTSLVCGVKDRAGALHQVLQPFADLGVTLLRIESRPLQSLADEQAFFIDVVGHQDDRALADVLTRLQPLTSFLKVLGSYPLVYQN